MDDASILSLNPREPIETSNVLFQPQPVPKSPLLAFLVSLIFPGAGQIYCGKTSRGLWTLAFFLPALATTVYLTRQLGSPEGMEVVFPWGIVLRIALFLYVFAFLDAFFTAREMTAGTDAFIAESPRIAAILNLLTRGFGYFYLGHRAAGFAVFIGLGIFLQSILNSASKGDPGVVGLFMEAVSAGLAIHAYGIARKRE